MSDQTCELRRPVRFVVWGWAFLVLLFVVTAPFVDVPWTVYIPGGTLYSLFLVLFSVGLTLLGKPNSQRAMMVMLATTLVGWGSIVLLLISRASLGVIGSVLPVVEVIISLAMVGVMALSIVGWIRFFRKRHNDDQPQTPPADKPGG